MKPPITQRFGVKHPIIGGGIQAVGFGEMAVLVSNAGTDTSGVSWAYRDRVGCARALCLQRGALRVKW